MEDAGFETWAVGGAVRDVLVGAESGDWDLATRARPEQVQRLFRRTVPLGLDHGTVGVVDRAGELVEVTTFRRDVETFGRHAIVEYADSLDEDLARRDFTINAVAWHPLREEIRDPFNGVGDLQRGVLQTVGVPSERFREDFLRVLRAIRFAGRFGLRVVPETWEALVEAVDHLDGLSPERIREELMKTLEKDPTPSGSLGLWAASGALSRVAPELAPIVGLEVEGAESRLDAWALACLSVDVLSPSRPLVRLGALLGDVGRAGADADIGHERTRDLADAYSEGERGHRRVAALMTRLRFSNVAAEQVAGIVEGGVQPPPLSDAVARRRWLALVGPERLADITRIWGARSRVLARAGGDVRAPLIVATLCRRLRAELASGAPLSVGDLDLDGKDLIRMGLKPGPVFGEILEALLDRVLEDPALNRREVLKAMVEREWPEGRPPHE